MEARGESCCFLHRIYKNEKKTENLSKQEVIRIALENKDN